MRHEQADIESALAVARSYRGYVVAICMRQGLGPEDAEEVFQDVSLAFVRSASKVRTTRGWLACVARRHASRRLAKLGRRASAGALEQLDERAIHPTHRERVLVEQLLSKLQPEARWAFVAHHAEGLEVCEVASRLGRTRAAAASLLARTRKRLRRLAEGHGQPGSAGTAKRRSVPAPSRPERRRRTARPLAAGGPKAAVSDAVEASTRPEIEREGELSRHVFGECLRHLEAFAEQLRALTTQPGALESRGEKR